MTRHRDWAEVGIGRMGLFIRGVGEARTDHAGLISLEGDVLPTVSRRDPPRRLANVWTSGNRIFRTNNPQLVCEAAIWCLERRWALASSLCSGALSKSVRRWSVAAELRALAAVEAKEEYNAPNAAKERGAAWR